MRLSEDAAPAAFFVLDEEGRFVAANQHAFAMLRYARTELLDLARVASAADVGVVVCVARPRRSLPADLTPARRPRSRDDRELTEREVEILQLVAEGLENEEISAQLYISTETVKSHVRRLLQKLDARSRTHAVSLGFRRGLLD